MRLLILFMAFFGLVAQGAQTREEFEAQLHYQQGDVVLKDGLATIHVPPEFRYLKPDQADLILVQAWGNPPGTKTLGMLFPADVSPLTSEGWGVVITYQEDGYVKDADAEKIDYNDLLQKMKKESVEDNAERKKQGYQQIDLVGWAEPPRYDPPNHKLYWAKELKVEGAKENTLNYNIRVLGRRGVLVLNAIAGMKQLPEITEKMQKVITFVDFNEGHRYAEFKPGVDRIAAYGIAGLIAGTVAAKTGLFKYLIGILIAAKKAVVAGVIAIGAFFKKLFGRKTERQQDSGVKRGGGL